MPELPEVEVTRLGLVDRLEGGRVCGARLGKPLRWPLGVPVESLSGRTMGTLQRRGKYLWLPLTAPIQAPGASGGVLLHLGMSGSLSLNEAAGEPGPHDHFELDTDRGLLRLTDPRRFGAVVWSDGLDLDPAARLLAKLGPEPFDSALTGLRLHAMLSQRRTTIKAALLAGDVVVGAGNIYVSEALYRSGIDPRQRCDRLSRPRCERLLSAIRSTLAQAITLGGSTLRDFKDAHGMSGAFQDQALVYGREGQPCGQCGQPVRRIVQAQRSTYFCPRCQRR